MIIQFYKCIVCGKDVGCKPNTPKEKRYCNTHKEDEVKIALQKLWKK